MSWTRNETLEFKAEQEGQDFGMIHKPAAGIKTLDQLQSI